MDKGGHCKRRLVSAQRENQTYTEKSSREQLILVSFRCVLTADGIFELQTMT